MAQHPTRTCPECQTRFTPRRVDQYFHARSCTDTRYQREYNSLFLEFPKALLAQAFQCYGCGVDAAEVKLLPLFLVTTDLMPVAACHPCKRQHYSALS